MQVRANLLLMTPKGVFFYVKIGKLAIQIKVGDFMTDRQRKFCDEYLIDCNATRAYKAAYPHVKNDNVAKSAGNRLLTFVDIKTYIDEQIKKLSSSKIATAEEVMEYLTSVMRGEAMSEIVVVEMIGNGMTQAKRFEKAPDEKEKLKAAELLGKRYNIFKETEDNREYGKLDILLEEIKNEAKSTK